MSVDAVFELLVEANPVPDPVALLERRPDDAVFLANVQQRGQMMKTEEAPARSVRDSSVGRPPMLMAAVLVLVVAVGWVLIQAVQGDDVAGSQTPIEIAEAYFAGLEALDVAQAHSVLAPDSRFVDYFDGSVTSPNQLASVFDWYAATGFSFESDQCTSEVAQPSLVTCEYNFQNALMAAPGRAVLSFDIGDGLITEVVQVRAPFFREFNEFRSFILSEHADDVAVMYARSGPEFTPESIALWEQYTQEYIAELGG